jgi:hypothetical protein
MTQSFFGGDPNVSHYTANVRYLMPDEAYGKPGRAGATQRRREQGAALKAIGFKERYFQFRNKDEAGKASARAECEAHAREWSDKVGFELEVAEGCFL